MMKLRRIELRQEEFLAGICGELTPAELGVYWMICLLQYTHNGHSLEYNMDWLRAKFRPTKANRSVEDIVNRLISVGKVYREGDEIGVRRVREEAEKGLRRIREATENGRRGGRPRKENNELRKGDGFHHKKLNSSTDSTDSTKRESSNDDSCSPPKPRADPIETEFTEKFWPRYPRKIARPDALKAFRVARKTATLDEILKGLEQYRNEVAGKDPQYIKLPAGWLRSQRWLDQAEAVSTGTETHQQFMERANGRRKPTASENLFLGAYRAAEAFAASVGAGKPAAEPLLEGERRSNDP